jgi:hypothetical protein
MMQGVPGLGMDSQGLNDEVPCPTIERPALLRLLVERREIGPCSHRSKEGPASCPGALDPVEAEDRAGPASGHSVRQHSIRATIDGTADACMHMRHE